MKLLSVIICFLFALTLWADAVVVIKGKERRSSIKLESRSGLSARVRRYNTTIEIGLRPRKKFQTAKLTFKVLNDDEYTFTLGGGYTRTDSDKKDVFEWIDCTLFRVNGKDLIGPKAEKGGSKKETLSRPKPVKGSVKLKKGAKLTVEITLRATPKREAKRLDAESSMDKRDKARYKREAAKDKARAAEEAREEKRRQAIAEANRRVLAERYGIKMKSDKKSDKKSEKTAAASKKAEASADKEEDSADKEEDSPDGGDE